ncbi:MAG: serine/threonine protein kinase [Hyalangium sp.]|uniref:serine/threonine protein kinase n=1 Tax=Hyalangium sp. TaxID=2028555 RepID=UPI00389A835C
MGKKAPVPEVDPLCLPVGMRVGPWRVKGWGGRGSYGTLYRVEREGHEEDGSFALKLAISPGDPRFEREAHLLSIIHSPHVPRLVEQGTWEHPSGTYPYLVMEWIDGEPLYAWAERRNPSLGQGLRVLAQVARALEATHAAGGVHRDVKGDNVMVRPADGQVFLTDFGAGHSRGAATLTSKLLPPGTGLYRSPEAWGFLEVFRRHPTVHYPASACDDLFALGVMAYRLVTDEYPPSPCAGQPDSEVWRAGGPGPRPPRELNPRVSPELQAIILRLLALAPVERFDGQARKAAEALEQAARSVGAEGDVPLFTWGDGGGHRWRSPGGVRLAAERDAAAKEEFERRTKKARVPAAVPQARRPTFTRAWGARAAVAFFAGVLSLVAVQWLLREHRVAQPVAAEHFHEGGSTAVGDSVVLATRQPNPQGGSTTALGRPLPDEPLPGQNRPPCTPRIETVIRGACWVCIASMQPPCGKNAYDWEGKCCIPSFDVPRQPTSSPPQ